MSPAAVVFVVAVVVGMAALGALGWRLYGQVRSLGRTVAANTERLETAAVGLDDARPDDPAERR